MWKNASKKRTSLVWHSETGYRTWTPNLWSARLTGSSESSQCQDAWVPQLPDLVQEGDLCSPKSDPLPPLRRLWSSHASSSSGYARMQRMWRSKSPWECRDGSLSERLALSGLEFSHSEMDGLEFSHPCLQQFAKYSFFSYIPGRLEFSYLKRQTGIFLPNAMQFFLFKCNSMADWNFSRRSGLELFPPTMKQWLQAMVLVFDQLFFPNVNLTPSNWFGMTRTNREALPGWHSTSFSSSSPLDQLGQKGPWACSVKIILWDFGCLQI